MARTGFNMALTLSVKGLAILVLSVTAIAIMLIFSGKCKSVKGKRRANYDKVRVMDSEMD